MILKISPQVFLLLLVVTCSQGLPRSRTRTTSRIVSGRPANPGEFPHQVSLRTPQDEFYCGGSIIAPSWTLTAAHCVEFETPTGIVVVAGTIYLNSGGVRHQSRQFLIHPQYNYYTLEYDVAVVENQTPFVFNALVAPIRLGSAFVGANENAVVAGWGGAGPEGPPWPNNLQALNVTTLTNPDCRSRHTEQNAEFVVDQKICTYYPYAGVCFGDSGGSLIVGNEVIGIVSWGAGWCGWSYPDVFIRISFVYDWIRQQTGV